MLVLPFQVFWVWMLPGFVRQGGRNENILSAEEKKNLWGRRRT